jgi:sec-independent protein translocase protein TatA
MFAFISPVEIVVVLVVVLLLFGGRIPSVMRNLGQGMMEFKKGVKGIEDHEEEAVKKPK